MFSTAFTPCLAPQYGYLPNVLVARRTFKPITHARHSFRIASGRKCIFALDTILLHFHNGATANKELLREALVLCML